MNPYGVAFVPDDVSGGESLLPGDILVSNFNNQANQQGRGTTIVKITPTTPTSQPSVFFQGQSGFGLTAALAVLRSGFVLVGNVPTQNGSPATIQRGSLLVLNHLGRVIAELADPKVLDGPWDLTVNDKGPIVQIFVSNVLNGTVTRLDVLATEDIFHLVDTVPIASGLSAPCRSRGVGDWPYRTGV